MPNSASAEKRVRQNEKRRMQNRSSRSTLKTILRSTADAISHGKDGQEKLRRACTALDQQASRGLIHRNAAARRKSRLARKLNRANTKAG